MHTSRRCLSAIRSAYCQSEYNDIITDRETEEFVCTRVVQLLILPHLARHH